MLSECFVHFDSVFLHIEVHEQSEKESIFKQGDRVERDAAF